MHSRIVVVGLAICSFFLQATSQATSASALSSAASCDVATLRLSGINGQRPNRAAWENYRQSTVSLVKRMKQGEEARTAKAIIGLQRQLLRRVSTSAYAKSPRCLVIRDLSPAIKDGLAGKSDFFSPGFNRLAKASLRDLSSLLSRARFANPKDMLLTQASSYCFVASLALVDPNTSRRFTRLEQLGAGVRCSEVGR